MSDPPLSELIRLIDRLELAAPRFITLDDLRTAGVSEAAIQAAISDVVLLVDQRLRLDTAAGTFTPIAPCRLNRHHPLVRETVGED